jgi:hypothetical protein
MRFKYKHILLAVSLLLILLFVFAKSPVRAAVDNNPILATIQYVQQAISTALSPIQSSLQGLNRRVSNLEATVSPIPSEITDLQNRVSRLESEINTSPAPLQGTVVFAYNRPASFTTDSMPIPLVPNYYWESMTMHVSTTGTLVGYSMLVNLGQGDVEQVRINCGQQTCPEVTIPLILDNNGHPIAYKFSTGTSSGIITAIGTLNTEPNSHSILIGSNLTLPYTSGDLITGGYSQIMFTVGQIDPQNLKSISIQQFDGTNWNEIQRINCDGGAICPVQLVTIGSTFHRTRAVIDGSGSGAVVDYLIRP